jgi:threonyl-tRNA synthetase
VRGFTQDDAHIFCTPEQIEEEIIGCMDFALSVLKTFGFSEYQVELSIWDPNDRKSYLGGEEKWELAIHSLENALKKKNIPYKTIPGEAAFYGPKIDFKLKDALKRKWQCATIQCDFTLPDRFDLSYIGADGEKHRPVMLHRVILGAIERFMGVLIEHHAGAFPVWLSPVQAVLMTVTDKHIPYGERVYSELIEAGIRAERDFRNEKLGYKIREAQMQKVPYMLVIGDREMDSNKVSPRERSGKDLGATGVNEFIELIREKSAQYQ